MYDFISVLFTIPIAILMRRPHSQGNNSWECFVSGSERVLFYILPVD